MELGNGDFFATAGNSVLKMFDLISQKFVAHHLQNYLTNPVSQDSQPLLPCFEEDHKDYLLSQMPHEMKWKLRTKDSTSI